MKQFKRLFFISLLMLFVLASVACTGGKNGHGRKGVEGRDYYGIEIDGQLCGYLESMDATIQKDGKTMKQVDQTIFVMQTLLGSQFNADIKIQWLEDPDTGQYHYYKMKMTKGEVTRHMSVELKDNTAVLSLLTGGKPKKIKMTPDLIFGDSVLFRRIKEDFYQTAATEKTYKVLDISEGKIQTLQFTKRGFETVKALGKTYQAAVFDQQVKETGLRSKMWIDLENRDMLKMEILKRKIFKTDHKVVSKIKVANMDPGILTKSNVSIADIQGISYMKVKACIEPTGVKLTPADLNVPGQRFTGTVKNNVIEGVFEIEHKRYNGENAPPFPPDFSGDPALKKYLEPDNIVESNDPVLIAKARELTRGAADSWDAARRLSKWVAENITYGIPGGETPRKTYDMREGECGAHSFLLTTFCRAVGIPSRVVWGGMYTPNLGGAFGQHGWNEIYMGEAGWITVDSTAFETDYIDSGHIRVSEYLSAASTFNGKHFEVLDYKLGNKKITPTDAVPAHLEKYTGRYVSPEKKTFTVKTENNLLVVVLPGGQPLSFHPPDEKGRWVCKLVNYIYLVMDEDDSGKVPAIDFRQVLTLPKTSPLKGGTGGVPESFKPYLGKYDLKAANLTLTVMYKWKGLAIHYSHVKRTVKLNPTGKTDLFIDPMRRTFLFERDENGGVTGLKWDMVDVLKRK